MIDTDKYEGHTEGEWRVDDKVGLVIKHGEGTHDYVDMENKANAQLMADAPLLLQEVKRLRDGIQFWFDTFSHGEDDIMVRYFKRLIE